MPKVGLATWTGLAVSNGVTGRGGLRAANAAGLRHRVVVSHSPRRAPTPSWSAERLVNGWAGQRHRSESGAERAVRAEVLDHRRAAGDTSKVTEPAKRVSTSTYLQMDADADGKLELLNGVVVAMAGASPRHNRIVANIARALGNALDGGPCLVFTQDQRVRVDATASYVYPDVVVVCEEPRFDTTARPASLSNPAAVIEVLSESTLDRDLGAKLGHYRQIASVDEVLFVHSETRATTQLSRQGDGSWKLVDRGPGGEVELTGVTLSHEVIYDRTDDLPT